MSFFEFSKLIFACIAIAAILVAFWNLGKGYLGRNRTKQK